MTKIIGVKDGKTRYYERAPDDIVQVEKLTSATKANLKILEDLGWKFEKTARVWFVKQTGLISIRSKKSFLVLGKSPEKKVAEFWMYYTPAWSSGRRAVFVDGRKYFGKGGSSTFGVDTRTVNEMLEAQNDRTV